MREPAPSLPPAYGRAPRRPRPSARPPVPQTPLPPAEAPAAARLSPAPLPAPRRGPPQSRFESAHWRPPDMSHVCIPPPRATPRARARTPRRAGPGPRRPRPVARGLQGARARARPQRRRPRGRRFLWALRLRRAAHVGVRFARAAGVQAGRQSMRLAARLCASELRSEESERRLAQLPYARRWAAVLCTAATPAGAPGWMSLAAFI